MVSSQSGCLGIEGERMRFDTWSKEQKQELDFDYDKRFGGQIRVMKKLYRMGTDPDLFRELLDNVSYSTYQALLYTEPMMVEALIERMFLSTLEYDVYLYHDTQLEEFSCDLYFYNDYDSMEFTDIRISNPTDMKKLIEMILYIGKNYSEITVLDSDAERNLDEYNFLEGFDIEILETNEEGLTFKRIKH
jgi:hypothetical protein